MPPKRNAFMVFTMDWKSKYGKHITLAEATEAAGKIWTTMNEQERAPYKERAREERALPKPKNTEKLTCIGTPLSLVEEEKREAEIKERQMKRDIENTVRRSVKSGQLATQSYFFIMVNHFTKTLKGGIYVPAELSVCEFSLRQGVNRIYQILINPGLNMYGHQYEAQHHSETTHNLPLPPNAFGEKNLGKIFNDILNFIRKKDTNDYPPLYTHRDCIHIVESVLQFLQADGGANKIALNIYPIQYLFFIMKEATADVGETDKPKNFYISDAFFERDHFEYHTGMACDYHERIDKTKYCTKSYVTRWGYMFADYMCKDIAISLIKGRHYPVTTDLNAIITPAPSTCNDNSSYISMGTTSSYATKPVAGSKIYYDDQKSAISDGDFPVLGAPNKSNKPKSSNVQKFNRSAEKNIVEEDDYGAPLTNPLSNRSRVVPRAPDDTNFSIDYSDNINADTDDYNSVASFGRGRGSIINSSLNTSIATTSTGRGRLNCPKKKK